MACGIDEAVSLPSDNSEDISLVAQSYYGGIKVSIVYPSSNPHALSYVIIYRATLNDFNNAVEIARIKDSVFFDELPKEATSSVTYYYWGKTVSVNGTEASSEVGPVNATAIPFITDFLTEIAGDINSTHLDANITSALDSIGNLDAKIDTEITNRVAGDVALATYQGNYEALIDDLEANLINETTNRVNEYASITTLLETATEKYENNHAALDFRMDELDSSLGNIEANIDATIQAALDGVSIGTVTGTECIAFGLNSSAGANKSNALGAYASTTAANAIALGYDTDADGVGSIAVGYRARALSTNTTSIGYNSTTIQPDGTSVGYGSSAYTNSVAVGSGAGTTNTDSIAIGYQTQCNGIGNTAIGYGSSTSNTNSIALGLLSRTTGNNGTALGSYAKCYSSNSIALGYNSTTNYTNSIAIGLNATTTKSNQARFSSNEVEVNNLVASSLAVSGSKSFRIPHPTREHYWLNHGCYEGDVGGGNIYRKRITTVNNTAVIIMPDWFTALNTDIHVFIQADKHFGSAYGEVFGNNIGIKSSIDGDYLVLIIGTRKDEGVKDFKVEVPMMDNEIFERDYVEPKRKSGVSITVEEREDLLKQFKEDKRTN